MSSREAGGDVPGPLNAGQHAAVTHGDGPLLVVAGAGSGKTRTLVHRVAHLLERGVRPERILLLTFTRRAAQEMLSRVERLAGSAGRAVHGGTFHATASRLLRRFGSAAGIPRGFSIMDQGDAADLLQLSRVELGLAAARRRFPKKETLQYVYSRHVNTGIPVESIVAAEVPQFAGDLPEIGRVFADYTRRKHDRNLLDYDDLLLLWALMVETDGALAGRVAALYEHILVDEYQDTNALQARILRGMARHHSNVTVVGDDAQSIYAFRGATIRNILDFPEQFPGTRVITLDRNYRSTPEILATSNAVIARAAEGYGKRLWTERVPGERPVLVTVRDEHEQARYVVERVLALNEEGIPLRGIAVLFRAGYMSAELEIELASRGIPFEKWGGIRFLEAAHVKDVLAFLRVLENPRDELSWYRILMLLPGVGEVTARAAIGALAAADWDAAAFGRFVPPPRARDAHAVLAALLQSLGSGAHGVGGEIAAVRRMYDAILRDVYDRAEPRLADLDQLEAIATGYPDRGAFLEALALEPPAGTRDLAGAAQDDEDVLVLSTVHSAKGREWDAVIVISVVDGWFPAARSLGSVEETEEERRLMYVAMTRARDVLEVVHPLDAYGSRWGSDYTLTQLSRFIDEEVRGTMRRHSPAHHGAGEAGVTPVADAGPLDLRSLLRQRFGG